MDKRGTQFPEILHETAGKFLHTADVSAFVCASCQTGSPGALSLGVFNTWKYGSGAIPSLHRNTANVVEGLNLSKMLQTLNVEDYYLYMPGLS